LFRQNNQLFLTWFEKHFSFKKIENAYALDSIKECNTILKLPQILTKTAQQQQAQPSLQHPSKGLDSSKLETTWFNSKYK